MISNSEILPHVRLQFHAQHPVFEACWNEGYDSAEGDLSEEENPYGLETREYQQWNDGWWAGFYGEERLFAQATETEIVSKADCQEDVMTGLPAVNDDDYHALNAVRWLGRFATVAGIVAVAVAAIELLEIAV